MKVRFLGNGGFISSGLPYNAFVLDGEFLIESPPDVMGTLRAQGIDYRRIRRIYLSHFHGDHYFGMPFITLNLMNDLMADGREPERIQVIGPKGLREHLMDLQSTAVSPDNPSVAWMDKLFDFREIDASARLRLPDAVEMIFHPMAHEKETYGFSILRDGECLLTYLADTRWDPSVGEILARKPRYVICDQNSGPGDAVKVHMAESDIIEKALPITGDATVYVGTHLRAERASRRAALIYASAGMELEID